MIPFSILHLSTTALLLLLTTSTIVTATPLARRQAALSATLYTTCGPPLGQALSQQHLLPADLNTCISTPRELDPSYAAPSFGAVKIEGEMDGYGDCVLFAFAKRGCKGVPTGQISYVDPALELCAETPGSVSYNVTCAGL